MNLFRRLVFIVTVSLAFFSCKDWWPYGREGATKLAKGSIYKNLEDRGDYGLFLRALEITGYKKAVNESDLLTVFAPNDAGFREYMTNTLGVSDLSEVLLDETRLAELQKTISYHIIQFAWSLDDFLGFTMSSDPEAPRGDGSVYKYKTLAREPIGYYTDPLSRRVVQLYNREKYLTVFSTNLFKSRGVPEADIENEYRRLYPNVNWQGTNDRLYVGEAAVTEQGILADNGYLYTIDKVATPQSTIYTLIDASVKEGVLAENHKLFARIIQRMNLYSYNKALSDEYALPGDSLFYHYTYDTPSSSALVPEIASEWTYHDELGSNVEYGMSWALTAMIPTDAALETWMRANLGNVFNNKEVEQVIDELPYNTMYHIVIAHLFDKRKLVIPYQLFKNGVTGAYHEVFKPTEEDVDYVKIASNGIVYGVNKANTPVLFERFTRLLFTGYGDKTFQFFAEAFNKKDMYMTAAASSENTPYTLFVVNDANLLLQQGSNAASYSPLRFYRSVVDPNNNMRVILQNSPNATFTSGVSNMNIDQAGTMMAAHLSYGYIPVPEPLTEDQILNGEHSLRYYKMQRQSGTGAAQYIYALDGEFYDEMDNPLGYGSSVDVKKTYGEEDGIKYGIVHELTEVIRNRGTSTNWREAIRWVAGANNAQTWKPAYKFKQLMKDAGIITNDGNEYIANSWNASKDFMTFAPSNDAIDEALAMGVGVVIPYYDPQDDAVDVEEQARRKLALERWCKFYIFDRFANAIDHYTLPGLDPFNGQTNQAYEYTFRTAVEYTDLENALYCKIGWDPADSFHMYLKDKTGAVAKTLTYWPEDPNGEGGDQTLLLPSLRSDGGMVFVIDHCFPYSTMTAGSFE